jgi:hypothetical protein
MPHASTVQHHGDDLVTVRFSVPADKVTQAADDVFISTSSGGVIAVPKTLLKDGGGSGDVVLEAQMPGDVAVAVRSLCAELYRLTCTEQEC